MRKVAGLLRTHAHVAQDLVDPAVDFLAAEAFVDDQGSAMMLRTRFRGLSEDQGS